MNDKLKEKWSDIINWSILVGAAVFLIASMIRLGLSIAQQGPPF